VVGLYLHPPKHAIVLCVDEKSQIQALEHTQPVRPVRPGRPERPTHDYLRHGTTTLFAALEVATGHITEAMAPRHRHVEFLAFLQQVAKGCPSLGDFASVEELVAAIRRFVIAWNQRCQPFTWTKDADTILGTLNRKNTLARIRPASANLSS
jgi:hypothetical protein